MGDRPSLPLTASSARSLIEAQTVVARPFLVPEVALRLVTDACPLWRATDADLEALGLPAPYWAFAWAGGQALARYVLDHAHRVAGKTVLSFGAGGGVEAIAAALAGATVVATDIDPFAVEALRINAALNGVSLTATDQDVLGVLDPSWDVVLVGDVTYETELAEQTVAWLSALSQRGAAVLLSDPGRGFIDPARFTTLTTYESPSDVDLDGTDLRTTPILTL